MTDAQRRTTAWVAFIAATVMLVISLSASRANAAAPAKRWYWTESLAEKLVVGKVVVPCARVRKPVYCNLAQAELRLRQWEDAVARCDNYSEYDRIACLAAHPDELSPRHELRHVRVGFPVDTAECIGGGQTDGAGFRFGQFRCKVTIKDYRPNLDRTLIATGRLALYVTGKQTFRWAIIP